MVRGPAHAASFECRHGICIHIFTAGSQGLAWLRCRQAQRQKQVDWGSYGTEPNFCKTTSPWNPTRRNKIWARLCQAIGNCRNDSGDLDSCRNCAKSTADQCWISTEWLDLISCRTAAQCTIGDSTLSSCPTIQRYIQSNAVAHCRWPTRDSVRTDKLDASNASFHISREADAAL